LLSFANKSKKKKRKKEKIDTIKKINTTTI